LIKDLYFGNKHEYHFLAKKKHYLYV